MNDNSPTGSEVSDGSETPRRDVGRRSARSAVLSLTLMLGAGVALGYFCHWIGLGHPKGKLFKILVAFPLSLVGAVLLWRLAFARRNVLVLAGLGAASAMLTMHYIDNRDFPRKVEPHLRDVLEGQVIAQILDDLKEQSRSIDEENRRILAKTKPTDNRLEIQAREIEESRRKIEQSLAPIARKLADPEKEAEMEPLLRRFKDELAAVRARIRVQGVGRMALGQRDRNLEPVVGPWLENLGLIGYLNLRAEQGVKLNLYVTEVHLGYGATIAYWIAEVLIAGLITAGVMHKLSNDKDVEKDFKSANTPSEPS